VYLPFALDLLTDQLFQFGVDERITTALVGDDDHRAVLTLGARGDYCLHSLVVHNQILPSAWLLRQQSWLIVLAIWICGNLEGMQFYFLAVIFLTYFPELISKTV